MEKIDFLISGANFYTQIKIKCRIVVHIMMIMVNFDLQFTDMLDIYID